VIAIVSSSARERTALVALCESQEWVAMGCDSVRSALRLITRSPPRVILTRHVLHDGFSDQILATLHHSSPAAAPKLIVIGVAATTASAEARQLNLGADCVLRDPLRTEVLLAYLRKYQSKPAQDRSASDAAQPASLAFAGGSLSIADRKLHHGNRCVVLTPREIELVEVLLRFPGDVVTYETLYSEILNRPFRGDTSNLRVLLGKLNTSAQSVGLSIRLWVEVIPKAGYRYRPIDPALARDAIERLQSEVRRAR
jgi:DNA-binding response OmpR family regulator